MPEFIATRNNLRISASPAEVERIAVAAAQVLRERGASKVYFVGVAGTDYPVLHQHKSDVSVVQRDNEPSNFLSCSRLMFDGSSLVVVSAERVLKDQWKSIGLTILERAGALSPFGRVPAA